MNEIILEAFRDGNKEMMKAIIEESGFNVNTKFNYQYDRGYTPLMYASEHGYPEIVSMLIRKNANVNAKNNENYTPLIYASIYNHIEVVRILLEAGADPNQKNIWGSSSLIYASSNENLEMVKALLEAGAIDNTCDITGNCALIIAAKNNNIDIVRAFLKAGFDVRPALIPINFYSYDIKMQEFLYKYAKRLGIMPLLYDVHKNKSKAKLTTDIIRTLDTYLFSKKKQKKKQKKKRSKKCLKKC
jgi:ankyrin repeat protein